MQEREYRVDAELVGVLGFWGTLGPVTGGEVEVGSEGVEEWGEVLVACMGDCGAPVGGRSG